MNAAIIPPAIETQNALIEPSYAVPIAPLLELVAAGDALGSVRVEETLSMLEGDSATETVTPVEVAKDVAVLVLCTVVLETAYSIDVEVVVASEVGVLDPNAVVVVSLSEEEGDCVEVTRSVEVTDEAGSVVKDVSRSVDTATEVTVTTAGLVLKRAANE